MNSTADDMSKSNTQSRIGLSTYSLFWEISDRSPKPLSVEGMIERTQSLGCHVLQICDYPPVEAFDSARLRSIRETAWDAAVELEVGTRGTNREHILTYVKLAESLGATMLRSMVQPVRGGLAYPETVADLKGLGNALETSGVSLALETYEQLSSSDLVRIVREVDNPRIGIALDPANCVAGLENPRDVIERCAPYTLNLHVKDFAFTRQAGWVGFTYAGAPMGEGLLDYEHEIAQVRPHERGINRIIEHWLVWQGTPEATVAEERRWTELAVNYIRSNEND